jgi:putative spermidine/putrescine transport system permease protein
MIPDSRGAMVIGHRNSYKLLLLPGLAFLILFFAFPVARLLLLSLQDVETHTPSIAQYAKLFSSDVYLRVLLETFRIACATSIISLCVGYPLAFWLARLPEAARNKVVLLVVLSLWTSYLVKTFSWMLILGHTGLINRFLLGIGLPELDLLHNEVGVLIGMVHAQLPLAVLTMLPVMIEIDGKLMQAAGSLGADAAQTFWMVFFPLSMPGVTAAGLLTFISSLGFFIVPALLGGRQQTMLAQLVIAQVQELLDWSFAGAIATLLLATALAFCLIYDRFFGLSTLAGAEQADASRASGRLRRAGFVLLHLLAITTTRLRPGRGAIGPLSIVAVMILIFLAAPVLVIVPIAFTKSQFLEFPPPGFSLQWFATYFSSELWLSATVRSFGVGAATAILTTTLAGFAALSLKNVSPRWGKVLFAFFIGPMIVPRIVIGVGLFYLFAQLGLVATDVGLVIGHTVVAMPYSFIAIASLLKNYDWRLDQAASILGANRYHTLRHITVPLIRNGIIAAMLFAFVTSFDELTIAIFVSGGVKTTLPKQMCDDMILQLNPTLAAVSVVTLTVVTTALVAVQRFRQRSSTDIQRQA